MRKAGEKNFLSARNGDSRFLTLPNVNLVRRRSLPSFSKLRRVRSPIIALLDCLASFDRRIDWDFVSLPSLDSTKDSRKARKRTASEGDFAALLATENITIKEHARKEIPNATDSGVKQKELQRKATGKGRGRRHRLLLLPR